MAAAMQTEDFPCLPSGLEEVNRLIKEHGDLFSDSQCKVCSAVLISESQKLTHYQSKKHANKVRRYLSIQSEKEPEFKRLKTTSEADCTNGDSDRSRVCDLCNMAFSSPVVAESHYQGKVHSKNLKLKMVGPPKPVAPQTPPVIPPQKKSAEDSISVPVAVSVDNSNSSNSNPGSFCSICNASFNNPLMAQQHYDGKKHRKQMTKQKLMETYGPSTAQQASKLKGYPCSVCNIELNSVEQYQSHITGAKHKTQVKKSQESTAENPDVAEKCFTENDTSYGPANDHFATTTDMYAPTDENYESTNVQYSTGDSKYTSENMAYSEEAYQFT